MPVEDFLELCETKIASYLDESSEYDIYTIWKDFWTIGSNQNGTKSLDNQRAIFGTTLDNSKYFDITYTKDTNKLYMKVYDIDDTEEYPILTTQE
jgi:hypothetical protein